MTRNNLIQYARKNIKIPISNRDTKLTIISKILNVPSPNTLAYLNQYLLKPIQDYFKIHQIEKPMTKNELFKYIINNNIIIPKEYLILKNLPVTNSQINTSPINDEIFEDIPDEDIPLTKYTLVSIQYYLTSNNILTRGELFKYPRKVNLLEYIYKNNINIDQTQLSLKEDRTKDLSHLRQTIIPYNIPFIQQRKTELSKLTIMSLDQHLLDFPISTHNLTKNQLINIILILFPDKKINNINESRQTGNATNKIPANIIKVLKH